MEKGYSGGKGSDEKTRGDFSKVGGVYKQSSAGEGKKPGTYEGMKTVLGRKK